MPFVSVGCHSFLGSDDFWFPWAHHWLELKCSLSGSEGRYGGILYLDLRWQKFPNGSIRENKARERPSLIPIRRNNKEKVSECREKAVTMKFIRKVWGEGQLKLHRSPSIELFVS